MLFDDPLLSLLVPLISRVRGVEAVVLGGSRSVGTATARSDYDIGIYYRAGPGLDTAALRTAVLPVLDDPVTSVFVQPGDWGPWIVGGAWLEIGGRAVDLLYRDLDAVSLATRQALSGQIDLHYQAGHPHCFASTIWLAELFFCIPLADRTGVLGKLKGDLTPYPTTLQRAVVERFTWEIEFSVAAGFKAVDRADQSYIAGCIFRSLACAAQVLHALNGEYLMNEKGAIQRAATLPVTVPDLAYRTSQIWSEFGVGHFAAALGMTRRIGRDVKGLVSAKT